MAGLSIYRSVGESVQIGAGVESVTCTVVEAVNGRARLQFSSGPLVVMRSELLRDDKESSDGRAREGSGGGSGSDGHQAAGDR